MCRYWEASQSFNVLIAAGGQPSRALMLLNFQEGFSAFKELHESPAKMSDAKMFFCGNVIS